MSARVTGSLLGVLAVAVGLVEGGTAAGYGSEVLARRGASVPGTTVEDCTTVSLQDRNCRKADGNPCGANYKKCYSGSPGQKRRFLCNEAGDTKAACDVAGCNGENPENADTPDINCNDVDVGEPTPQ